MTQDQIKTAGAAGLNRLAAEVRGWKFGIIGSHLYVFDESSPGERDGPYNPSKDHNQAHELIQHGIDTWGGTIFLWKYWWNLTFCVFGEYAETKERNVLLLNTTPEQKTRAALLAICELEGR